VLRDAVLELKRGGATVLFSTHDMDVAEKMCDFIFMIFKGRKVLDGTLEQIQSQYGSNMVRVRMEEDGAVDGLGSIPGVERVNNFGRLQELRIARGTDTQAVLAALMARGRVRHFELASPSLHDIFIRIAGPEAQEASRA
jgi:ABC-2 type transport system ATP-binding protein